ncbi:STAS domain-containing protein [Actinosynnema sp. NPDC020468]|uniref:STAS domain-containing protein n=1 Tax=Actinosynnema sp. NPDC020468 TaxID=3154488 RepID=UPI0033DE6CB4
MRTPATPTFTSTVDGAVAHVVIRGELAYETGDELVAIVDDVLTLVAEVRVDCAELGFCDSYGLSTLLLVQRRLHAADVRLSLVNRSAALDRLLKRTNTFLHLTNPAPDTRRRRDN